MARGGVNRGTMKTEWRSGKTCLVRVPIAIKDPVLRLAKSLDRLGEMPECPAIVDLETFEQAISLLEESLQKKANYGGQIKSCVKQALALLAPSHGVEQGF